MHTTTNFLLVLVASLAAAATWMPQTASALSLEEQKFLAAEVRAWLNSQAGRGGHQQQRGDVDDSAIATFIERRLR